MVRFYTPNLDEACDALDLYDIDYDLDFTMKQAKKTLRISLPGGISMTRIILHFRLLPTRKL